MPEPRRYYRVPSSTKWVPKPGTLGGPHGPTRGEEVVPPLGARVKYRDARKGLWLEVSFQGGAEAMWKIKARGETWMVSGHVPLSDLMNWLNGIVQKWERD